jgi:cytochrome P450
MTAIIVWFWPISASPVAAVTQDTYVIGKEFLRIAEIQLRTSGDAIAVFRGSPNRTVEDARAAQDAMLHLTDYFRKTVTERKRNKGNDLISLLIDIEEEGEILTEEEVYARCIALLFAGHETTRNLIGNGMYTLLKDGTDGGVAQESGDDSLGRGRASPF